jgi:hypothetical protein
MPVPSLTVFLVPSLVLAVPTEVGQGARVSPCRVIVHLDREGQKQHGYNSCCYAVKPYSAYWASHGFFAATVSLTCRALRQVIG